MAEHDTIVEDQPEFDYDPLAGEGETRSEERAMTEADILALVTFDYNTYALTAGRVWTKVVRIYHKEEPQYFNGDKYYRFSAITECGINTNFKDDRLERITHRDADVTCELCTAATARRLLLEVRGG